MVTINNYRPVLLHPGAHKIFEKIIYNNHLNYIERENLLNVNNSVSMLMTVVLINHLYNSWNMSYVNCSPSLEVRSIVYFWVYPKPWQGLARGSLISSLNLLESVENCSIFLIGFKGYYWMAKNLADFL